MKTGILQVAFILLSVVVLFSRCGSVKSSVTSAEKAETLFTSGNYAEALELYRHLIATDDEHKQPVDAAILKNAAVAASHQKDHRFTLDCIERLSSTRALNIDEAALYADNAFAGETDRTLAFFNNHRDLLISSMGSESYYSRLCQLNGEAGNADGVVSNWPQANRATKLEWFRTYYEGVKNQMSAYELMALCDKVLAMDSNQKEALHNKAVLLYEKSEATYKKLMDDYNKEKNATTYAYLRRDLKLISTDYRECRDLFEKLRKLEPDNNNYTRYLYNVYIRLDLNDQAKQLEKLL